MPLSIQDAIDHLYEIAVTQGKSQSPARLSLLAQYCVQELATRGLTDAVIDQNVPGGGRTKSWDVAWKYDGKYRLAISLKSMLKNLPGTVPNRVDDLMGEVANAQLHSPEIVLGYIMIIDIAADVHSARHGSTWADLLGSRLESLSGRCPPQWTVGMIEGYVLARVNFSRSTKLLSDPDDFPRFFDTLAEQVRFRNPNAPGPPTP